MRVMGDLQWRVCCPSAKICSAVCRRAITCMYLAVASLTSQAYLSRSRSRAVICLACRWDSTLWRQRRNSAGVSERRPHGLKTSPEVAMGAAQREAASWLQAGQLLGTAGHL